MLFSLKFWITFRRSHAKFVQFMLSAGKQGRYMICTQHLKYTFVYFNYTRRNGHSILFLSVFCIRLSICVKRADLCVIPLVKSIFLVISKPFFPVPIYLELFLKKNSSAFVSSYVTYLSFLFFLFFSLLFFSFLFFFFFPFLFFSFLPFFFFLLFCRSI